MKLDKLTSIYKRKKKRKQFQELVEHPSKSSRAIELANHHRIRPLAMRQQHWTNIQAIDRGSMETGGTMLPIGSNQPAKNCRRATGGCKRPSPARQQASVLSYIYFIFLSMQLYCDILAPSQQEQSLILKPTAAFELSQNQSDSSPPPSAAAKMFSVEPKDLEALIGQTIRLPCLADSRQLQSLDGNLDWIRTDFGAVTHNELIYVRNRYFLPGYKSQQPEETNNLSSAPNQAEGQDSSMAAGGAGSLNYTLEIKSLALYDDSVFYCQVQYHSNKVIASNRAKLTVLKQPTQLTIKAFKLNSQDGYDEISEQSASQLAERNGQRPNGPEALERERVGYAGGGGNGSEPAEYGSGANALAQANGTGPSSVTGGQLLSTHVIIVKQNDHLRLDCESDLAKPHAELIWLDEQQNQVPKRNNLSRFESIDYYVEESHERDEKQPKLFKSKSSLFIKNVQRNGQSLKFTCLANHRAFELMNDSGSDDESLSVMRSGLRQSIRLDVHFAPEVELVKSSNLIWENRPFKLTCKALARPMFNLKFRWFIDNQLLNGANEAEVNFEKITRQLHLRQISCECSNEIGITVRELKLSILYSPAYITPLLPLSLQPAIPFDKYYSHGDGSGLMTRSKSLASDGDHAAGSNRRESSLLWNNQFNLRQPTVRQFQLANELAIGYEFGQDLELRCDFDSNPRLTNVSWFKIRTDYDTMQEISSSEADELIASGATRAIFKEPQGTLDSDGEQQFVSGQKAVSGESNSFQLKKRHIYAANAQQHYNGNGNNPMADEWQELASRTSDRTSELDYEQMSQELLRELAYWQRRRNQPEAADSNNLDAEQLFDSSLRQTNQQIFEPLDWHVRRVVSTSNGRSANQTSNHFLPPVETIQVSLIKPDAQTYRAANPYAQAFTSGAQLAPSQQSGSSRKLFKREVQVSSSSISFKSVSDDFSGKFVCKTEHSNMDQTEMAHSVYLIQRRQPRIISQKNQFILLDNWERKIQVDCLVQINTIVETRISWFKNGKPINLDTVNEMGGSSNQAKNISIEFQRSPDFLFMRSILRINNADQSDFGIYNCTAENAFKPMDYLEINLQQTASTGFLFMVCSSIAIGTVLILVCLLGLLVACFSLGRDNAEKSKEKLAAKSMAISHQIQAGGQAETPGSKRELPERKLDDGQMSEESQDEGIVCESSSANNQQPLTPNQAEASFGQQRQLANGQQLKQQQQQRFNFADDQMGDQFANKFDSLQLKIKPFSGGQQRPNVSSKFSAIHESLENRLQFNPSSASTSATSTSSAAASASSNQPKLELDELIEAQNKHGAHLRDRPSQACDQVDLVSQINSNSSSLIERFLAKLSLKKATASQQLTTISHQRANNGRSKTRPTISMPISQTGGGSSTIPRKSSISTSLSMLHNSKQQFSNQNGSDISKCKNLLSSSANLIQDSSTGESGASSDNCAPTSSSSRSSSSGDPTIQHHLMQNLKNEQLAAGSGGFENNHQHVLQQQQQIVRGSVNALSGWQQSPKLLMINENQQQQHYANAMVQDSINVSSTSSSYVPIDNNLYSNTFPSPRFEQATHLVWNPLAVDGAKQHYQMPIGAASVTLDGQPSIFATNNFQQQQSNYGPLPGLNNSIMIQQQSPMIQTSDGAEAFFESNYNTLLSSAYRNYNQLQQANNLTVASDTSSPSVSQYQAQAAFMNHPALTVQSLNLMLDNKQNNIYSGNENQLSRLSSNDNSPINTETSINDGSATTTTTTAKPNNINENGNVATHV